MRWKAIYLIITRALHLQEALNIYANKLRISIKELNKETFLYNYLTP
jgi:hypothetical protein